MKKGEFETLRKKAVAAGYWLFGSTFLAQMISWGVTLLLARILTPADYGLLGMAQIMITFMLLFNEVGLGPVIIQKKDLGDRELSSCFWIIMGINLLICLLAWAASPLVSLFFEEPRLTPIIRVLSVNFIIAGLFTVPQNLLVRDLNFKVKGGINLISRLFQGGTGLIFAMNGFGVWSLVFGILGGNLVTLVLVCSAAGWRPRWFCSYRAVRPMMHYGYKVASAKLLHYLYSNTDYIIGGKILGKTELGYYSMAFQLSSMPLQKIVMQVKQICFPYFARLQEDETLLREQYLKIVKFTALITFPMFTGMALVADDAIHLVLTEKWAPMTFPFKVLCITAALRSIGSLADPLVNAVGRPEIGLKNVALCSVVLPPVFYMGCGFGVDGLAISWLLAYPALFLVMVRRSIRVIGLSLGDFLWNLVLPAGAVLAMAGSVLAVKWTLFLECGVLFRLVGLSVIGALVYAGSLRLTAGATLLEIRALLKGE